MNHPHSMMRTLIPYLPTPVTSMRPGEPICGPVCRRPSTPWGVLLYAVGWKGVPDVNRGLYQNVTGPEMTAPLADR
jgi:hypothetical protein